MSPVVLDASALIATMRAEPGAEKVSGRLDGAMMSAVNFAEVAGYLIRAGATPEQASRELARLPILVVSATVEHALEAAALLPATRSVGLSLGDRFCLALARAERRPALTADRAWAELGLQEVKIELIR